VNLFLSGNKWEANVFNLSKKENKMDKINLSPIKKPLIVFLILILFSLTVPFLLPATFFGAYLFWIILSLVVILYGLLIIGGGK